MSKEESSNSIENESDVGCDTWDEDCVIRNVQLDSESQLYGFHLIPSCENEPSLEPPKKQMKLSLELRNSLTTSAFVEKFKDQWTNSKETNEDGVELFANPYQLSVIQNFLHDEEFVKNLVEEFNEVEYNKRNMDLYEFFQSKDLKHLKSHKNITKFYKFLKTDVKNWLQALTGEKLHKISATCSVYGDTDYLLVHDDLQEDRVFAFVFYLNGPREWKPENGGSLQVIDIEENKCVRDISPCNNQFVFFKVSDKSYHQVAEITCKNDCRLSINGWFHNGKPTAYKSSKSDDEKNFGNLATTKEPTPFGSDFENWINPTYCTDEVAQQIQDHIENYSEISLESFLHTELFSQIYESLENNEIEWIKSGPISRRNYEIISEGNVPSIVRDFLNVFSSTEMFEMLFKLTDLKLTSVRYELQRWTHGCYELIQDPSDTNELDLILFFGCSEDPLIIGGQFMYIAIDQVIQDALVTIEPSDNCLNIVYRDTSRLTKHVSKYSADVPYYVLLCSYSE